MPHVRDMSRETAGDDEDRIDPDVILGSGEARRERLGGGRHAAEAKMIQGSVRFVGGGASLHLDEGEGAAALRDHVHLTDGRSRSPRENAPAVKP